MDMCPLQERLWREKQKLLHPFELAEETGNYRLMTDSEKAVKEFRRSAAGQMKPKAEDVRPPCVLKATMRYMINNLLLKSDVPWVEVYNFMFDRIRAVRQDLTLQQIWNSDSCEILEIAVRFYIYAAYRLCDESVGVFDSHINSVHLQECLKQLLVLYQSLCSPAREEITSLYLLHNMNSSEALHHVLTLPRSLRNKCPLKMPINICILNITDNYVRIIHIVEKLTVLQLCIMFDHVHTLQRKALNVMDIAFGSRNAWYPLDHLSKSLFFKDLERTVHMCNISSIAIVDNKVLFRKEGSFSASSKVKTMQKKLPMIDEKLHKIDIRKLMLGVSDIKGFK